MAVNLVSLVMQFLTPEVIGRIAAALGLDRSNVQTAVNSVVPSLLGGLSNVAARPGGAQELADAAAQQSGALEGFSRMLGAGNHSSLIANGSQMLSSLLGSGGQSALADAIGKFSGIGSGTAGSLLGMLAPVVLGTIAQQQGPGNLDPGKIAGLLASQKDNIAAAMPPRLSNMLADTGLLDSLEGAARTTTAAGSDAARASVSTIRSYGSATRAAGASASPNWLWWLIPAAAIAALLIYFTRSPEPLVQQDKTTAATTAQPDKTIAAQDQTPAQQDKTVGLAPASTMVAGVDVNKQINDSLGTLRATLGGVTDSASAQAALPKLREVAAQIDTVSDLRGQMSPEQQRIVAESVKPVMPPLNQLFDKVLAVPGIPDDLKPTVDALKTKLGGLAT